MDMQIIDKIIKEEKKEYCKKKRKKLSREEKEKIHDIIENLKAGEYNVE